MSSSSSSSSSLSMKQPEDPPDLLLCGQCGDRPKKGETFKTCSGCSFVAYCSAACQLAAWPDHKGFCKEKKKAKAKSKEAAVSASAVAKAKAPGSGSGRGSDLVEMGSILAALNKPQPQPQPQPHIYWDGSAYNACFYGQHEELQKILRHRGISVNWADPKTGMTAAFIAAQEGHSQCLSLLAQHGSADLSKAAKDGFAPIHKACQNGRYSCLKVLLDNNVDANLRMTDEQGGDTPAMIATSNGHVKLLALLLDTGSDPNLSNNLGTTAAHRACQYGHLKCLQLLRERNADLNTQNADGNTPLDLARMYKQPECVDLLLACRCVGRNKEDLYVASEAEQETNADFAKRAKGRQREARRCDLPACQATAADLNLGERFKKCPACRTAIYCCKDHAVRHNPEHESLCKELTRICDHPKCKEGADIDIMCRRCKVATYCSRKHREKHSLAHESRCEELCEWR